MVTYTFRAAHLLGDSTRLSLFFMYDTNNSFLRRTAQPTISVYFVVQIHGGIKMGFYKSRADYFFKEFSVTVFVLDEYVCTKTRRALYSSHMRSVKRFSIVQNCLSNLLRRYKHSRELTARSWARVLRFKQCSEPPRCPTHLQSFSLTTTAIPWIVTNSHRNSSWFLTWCRRSLQFWGTVRTKTNT